MSTPPPIPSTPTAATAGTAASPSAASIPASPAAAATATVTATSSAPTTHEERLLRTWRGIQTSAIQMMSKAEKSAGLMQQEQQKQPSGKPPNALDANPALKESFRDVDESVVQFLRTRIEFHRLLSHVEAKLQGKAGEMESLETYIATEPKVGEENCKKRKLEAVNGEAQHQKDAAAGSS